MVGGGVVSVCFFIGGKLLRLHLHERDDFGRSVRQSRRGTGEEARCGFSRFSLSHILTDAQKNIHAYTHTDKLMMIQSATPENTT